MAESRKSFPDSLQQTVRPSVFGGEDDESDQQKEDALQNRQEQTYDAEDDKHPTADQNSYTLPSSMHNKS